jgi:CheY-like chemotaxis protein
MSKILLVEDDELNRDMLSRRLIRNNYDVIFAVDGLEGVNKAVSDLPDLILMDMNMPEMDGLEAVRLIKKNPVTANIPVIIYPHMPCLLTLQRQKISSIAVMITTRNLSIWIDC